ncbi:fungal-specific transcription factor domain-containing protein [Coniochaeta sp. 2T2.1]|nr:fungal-specific transcription factor domain-containing protein [Coniochaeta sp. 2T2.1]
MDDDPGSAQGDPWSPTSPSVQQYQHEDEGEPTPPDVPDSHRTPQEHGSGGGSAGAAAARRRRRVTRACDECRRKKIKCDGKQPCENCTAFNEAGECTFNKPSKRRRPVQLHQIETRLQTAESLLRRLMPHCDLEKDDALSRDLASFLGRAPLQPSSTEVRPGDAQALVGSPEPEDASFIPLIERIGEVDLNDDGEWDFHGRSSGATYFGHMTKNFPELLAYDSRIPFLPQAPRPSMALPLGTVGDWSNFGLRTNPTFYELPPRQLARALCEYSFNCATCILRSVHVPSFYRMFDSIYDMPSQIYSGEQRRFLGLLYAVLALGSMYDVDENDPSNPDHYAVAMDQGFKFYTSARLFLHDLTECRDMVTLQALVFIIHFLQATSNLSECYTFVGIALRSALRMGLHRHLPHVHMTPIDDETRRRAFHVIQQMDIFLSTTIGLPLVLQDKDIDQPLPTEVNDEYITEREIQTPPPGTHSFFQAFNAHAKLMRILAKVVQHLYPPNGTKMETTNVTYMISYARIKEIEKDLHDWSEQLPAAWRPGPEGDVQVVRVRALLRFAYAHVQMMLYRPFLHYSPRETGSGGEETDERSLACQTAGINVCRNIVHIGLEIRKQAVLIGPYWFIMYTQFLAVLSLVFYVLNNPDKPTCADIINEAELGKDAICGLSQRSLAADRVAAALQVRLSRPSPPPSDQNVYRISQLTVSGSI